MPSTAARRYDLYTSQVRAIALGSAEADKAEIEGAFAQIDAALEILKGVRGLDAVVADLAAGVLDAADSTGAVFNQQLDDVGALGELAIDFGGLPRWRRAQQAG